jgi:hypothetical protein
MLVGGRHLVHEVGEGEMVKKDKTITVDGVKLPEQFPTSITLLAKLASVVVHLEETIAANGLDQTAVRSLLDDPEVRAWMKSMGAYLPAKREQS